ncbi:MAG: CoA transferase [Gammaproteobacteria bacterium]|nr:CoA transferase [Gammaproteobacteria bacterium]
MSGPLSGLRVVELATAIQGPAVGLHFANMGADVVKVEPPMGDASRYHRGVNNTLPEHTDGAQFVAMNKGKRSVVLDLHAEPGPQVMHALLATADVFLSNYRAAALARMSLDLDQLAARYPRLVVGHVNGFGPRGPDAAKAMLDGAAQARGGLASLSGNPHATPTPPGAAVADHAGAMQLALGCVTALVTRATTGRGQVVRTSSLGAQLWLQMWELQHSFLTGVPLSRDGGHHPNIKAPYGVYTTSDGVHILFVTAITNEAWSDFWIFVDRPEVILLEDWDSPGKRVGAGGSGAGVGEIRALVREAFASKPWSEWAAFLNAQPGLVWERVRDHGDVLGDPQNAANDYVVEIELPMVGKTSTVGTLMDFSATPTDAPAPPPGLGAHTGEVMAALGFDAEAIAKVTRHAAETRDEMLAALLGDDGL